MLVGAGDVGKEMIRLLRKRKFPAESIVIPARSALNAIEIAAKLIEQRG